VEQLTFEFKHGLCYNYIIDKRRKSMKETAIKMHLYIQSELTEDNAHALLRIITQKATEAGIPMTFQIHEIEVTDDGR
jgi:hypothetical protein